MFAREHRKRTDFDPTFLNDITTSLRNKGQEL